MLSEATKLASENHSLKMELATYQTESQAQITTLESQNKLLKAQLKRAERQLTETCQRFENTIKLQKQRIDQDESERIALIQDINDLQTKMLMSSSATPGTGNFLEERADLMLTIDRLEADVNALKLRLVEQE